MAEAAARVILTVERIIPVEESSAHPEWTRIPGIFVTAVVAAPRGAYPCGCMPDYDVDPKGIAAYLAATGSTESLMDYLNRLNP
jgi:glutaconate CoA-transferase subunit A